MLIERCPQGHFYDADVHESCPLCASGQSVNEILQKDEDTYEDRYIGRELMGVPAVDPGDFISSRIDWDVYGCDSPESSQNKEKCKKLKKLRQLTAVMNWIPIEIADCTQEGECMGTCPACEMELDYLNACLEVRRQKELPVFLPENLEEELGKETGRK